MWSDDERSTTYRTINMDQHSTNNYVPIWMVLKQMYDEDKDALYCHASPKGRREQDTREKDSESVASWGDYYYEDYCSEYGTLSDDYYSEDDESQASDTEDSSSSTDEPVDCNNKFVYI